jgi:hypothetical protein
MQAPSKETLDKTMVGICIYFKATFLSKIFFPAASSKAIVGSSL